MTMIIERLLELAVRYVRATERAAAALERTNELIERRDFAEPTEQTSTERKESEGT